MRTWLFILSGLIVWTGHFFAVYFAASLFPGDVVAHWLTLAATVGALIALGAIFMRVWRRTEQSLERWASQFAALGAAIASIAVLWQGLPAILI